MFSSRIILVLLCVTNIVVHGYSDREFFKSHAMDLNLYESSLDPELCSKQLEYIAGSALLYGRFLDAGIRIPKGLLDGNFHDLGNYYQCLAINEVGPSSIIHGKYCSISIPLQQDNIQWPFSSDNTEYQRSLYSNIEEYEALNSKIHGLGRDFSRASLDGVLSRVRLNIAVCIPKSCTTRQAMDLLLFNTTALGAEFNDNYCRLPNDKPFAVADYVAFAVFGLLGVLTVLSTGYDVCHTVIFKKDQKSVNSLYQSFSVYTNARRLTTYKSSGLTIECLDGIRVLAMAWIILLHCIITQSLILNPIDIIWWMKSGYSVYVTAGFMSVDTFFLISGILVVYNISEKYNRVSLLKNIHCFYFNRLLRMFPILAACVLLTASWFNHIADGPNWTNVIENVHKCRTNWWSTLLHIQNYVHPLDDCLTNTWYLAVDTHLHILSPIILFWVLTNKRCAWIALFSALLICLTSATIFITVNGFMSSFLNPGLGGRADYATSYYMNTLTRASPFLVGMIFGYLLFICRGKNILINKVIVVVMWLLSTAVIASILYITYRIQQPDWDNVAMDVLINSFMRALWALALGWLIFACVHGYAGPLNWFLSLQFWKIPSRLSFAMYVFHYPLLFVMNSTMLAPFYFSDKALVFIFFRYFSMALLVGFLVCVLVDAPLSNFIRIIIGSGKKHPKTPKTADEK